MHKFLTDKGVPVEQVRFPDRTTAIGKMINSYLLNKADLDDMAIHLLFAANRWEAASKLKETLAAGKTVICDRYSYSGIAFSVQKGLSMEWCKAPEIGLPAPDKVIYLTLPVEEAEKRGGYGEERYEKKETQLKVDKIFKSLQAPSWEVVDASPSIDELHQSLQKIVLETVEGVKDQPLGVFDKL